MAIFSRKTFHVGRVDVGQQNQENSFWSLKCTADDTHVWRSLLQIRDYLFINFIFKIRNGEGISFLYDHWLPGRRIVDELPVSIWADLGRDSIHLSAFICEMASGATRGQQLLHCYSYEPVPARFRYVQILARTAWCGTTTPTSCTQLNRVMRSSLQKWRRSCGMIWFGTRPLCLAILPMHGDAMHKKTGHPRGFEKKRNPPCVEMLIVQKGRGEYLRSICLVCGCGVAMASHST